MSNSTTLAASVKLAVESAWPTARVETWVADDAFMIDVRIGARLFVVAYTLQDGLAVDEANGEFTSSFSNAISSPGDVVPCIASLLASR